jgi:hypothetical protein
VFSVGAAPILYNEDLTPARRIIEGVLWDRRRRGLGRDGDGLIETWKSAREEKTSRVLQLQWNWYNYGVEIRCQDATSED